MESCGMEKSTSSEAVGLERVIPNSSYSSNNSVVTEGDPSNHDDVDINNHDAPSEHDDVNHVDALDAAAFANTGTAPKVGDNLNDVLVSVPDNEDDHESTQSKTTHRAVAYVWDNELAPSAGVLPRTMPENLLRGPNDADGTKEVTPSISDAHSLPETLPILKADSPQSRQDDTSAIAQSTMPSRGDDSVQQAASEGRVEGYSEMDTDAVSRSETPYLRPADMALAESISDKGAADNNTSDPVPSPQDGTANASNTKGSIENGHAANNKKRTCDPSPPPSSPDPPLTPAEEKCTEALNARTVTLEQTLADVTTQRSNLLSTLSSLPSIRAFLPPTITSDATSSSSTNPSSSEAEPPDEAVVAAAKAVIKRHIKLLHDYNEIRDIGQGLMGMIADSRAVRIRDVQEEFGVDPKD